ncbi:unnamed protein product [Fraxinus pennsylvanica]|uniref:ARM repeat superfamily protein n=1 Tax=Fraxinus pennsylvanica TaxID=56036 RepID=A0AAD1YXL7_9LAMI|nr:unnamed protein product [Fraxinus pennsylvanica]
MGFKESGQCHLTTVPTTVTFSDAEIQPRALSPSSNVNQTLLLLQSDEVNSRVQAAAEIRRLTKTSQRYRRHFSGAVKPLVDMLFDDSIEAKEAALAALLNLAVKDETLFPRIQ